MEDEWAEGWARLKCLPLSVEQSKDETDAEFLLRKKRLATNFGRPEIMNKARYEVGQTGSVAKDSDVWDDTDSSGATVIPTLDAARVETEPVKYNRLAAIFLDILRFLLDQVTLGIEPREVSRQQSLVIYTRRSGRQQRYIPSWRGHRSAL